MSSSRQRGLSLIETVIFIVVLGIGIAGLAVLYNQLTLASVDPLVRKQAVAVASSLMEEIQLRPFTFCDPDDPAVFTAASAAGCGTPEGVGAEGGETRYGPTFFDNVSDYAALPPMAGSIQDITNTTISDLTGYSAQVQIVAAGGDFPAAIPADEALRITVTVTGPANTQVVLQGYRLRYAPNSP
ncbi:MAG: prepilin-type N-terminal cleavage/methylation domain-containing protein [Burkholderiales bacterium]